MAGRLYEYRPEAGRLLARAVGFWAAALWLGYMAQRKGGDLVVFVFPVSARAATLVYAASAAASGLLAVRDLANVNRREALRQRVALGDKGLLVPRSEWSTEEDFVPYRGVVAMTEYFRPDHVVNVRHAAGGFTLRPERLPDARAFDELCRDLARAVVEARAEAADAEGSA